MVLVYWVVGLAFLLAVPWAPISLLGLGLDNSRMNRRIKNAESPPPNELREVSVIVSQFVPIAMVNLLSGVLAGIGASLFVDGGRFRWPSSQAPIILITIAVVVTEFTGAAFAWYVTRPARLWVTDSSRLRSYLRELHLKGGVREGDLVEMRRLRLKWSDSTNVRPLRSPRELQELGLELPTARQEWTSLIPSDPMKFGVQLLADVSRKQAWRWIMRKRLWRLGIPPFISGFALAIMIVGLITSARLTVSWAGLLFLLLGPSCISLLYWWAFRVGRLDLVMTNRYLALEQAQLRDCDSLIKQIEEGYKRDQEHAQQTGPDRSFGRLMLRIGRWDLRRNNDGMSAD